MPNTGWKQQNRHYFYPPSNRAFAVREINRLVDAHTNKQFPSQRKLRVQASVFSQHFPYVNWTAFYNRIPFFDGALDAARTVRLITFCNSLLAFSKVRSDYYEKRRMMSNARAPPPRISGHF
jgi:hypothetical protein